MLREVIGAIFAIFVGVLLLWLLHPQLQLLKNSAFDLIDSADPATAQNIALGDALYYILGVIPFVVIAFLIMSRATKSSPYEVN